MVSQTSNRSYEKVMSAGFGPESGFSFIVTWNTVRRHTKPASDILVWRDFACSFEKTSGLDFLHPPVASHARLLPALLAFPFQLLP